MQSNLNIEEEVPQHAIPKIYLVAAVERLYDYCEDARVELEILVADEARIAQGYETLLKISAAEYLGNENWRQKIDSFIEGTDPSIEKAKSNFESKLDNLMHDIAIIKKTLHDNMDPEATTGSLSRSTSLDNTHADNNAAVRSSSPIKIVKPNARKLSNGRSMASSPEDTFNWRAFTSTIRSPPSRSSSP
ncbi:7654_t:CDS:1, partial [Acaulospora colombiana]